jgi:smad nuclear-interacting protein 1
MSSSTTTNNRKRSRWGDSTDNNNNKNDDKACSVSDQEALEALLSSVKSDGNSNKSKPTTSSNRPSHNASHHNRHEDRHQRNDTKDHEKGSYQRRPQHNTNTSKKNNPNGPDYSYYGRPDDASRNNKGSEKEESFESQHYQRSQPQKEENTNTKKGEDDAAVAEEDKQKPNFGLSGALAQEQVGDYKFREPPEAKAPKTRWRLYVFKDDKPLETLHISRQSAYLIGRNKDLCDIVVLHPSLSSQHAVLQYRALPRKEDGQLHVKPYMMDLESTNGSFINGIKLDPARYYELKKGDVITFGASTREYVLLTETTTSL